jgi:hypothetical protein
VRDGVSVSIVLGLPSTRGLSSPQIAGQLGCTEKALNASTARFLRLAGLDPGRRPLGTEIQIEWRSEWQPENDHLKPSGIVDVLKLCRYGWTCKKCSLRANDIKMPDQKQRERPREESAPWTPKEQSPFDGPRTPNV